MNKHDFCSDGWLAEAHRILTQLSREYAGRLGDEQFSASETYTNAPPHLQMDSSGNVYWSMRVGANRAEVSRELRANADVQVVTDYSSVLVRARTIYDGNETEVAARRKQVADAVARGERSSDLSHLSLAMMSLLRELHNDLAAVTA